MILYIAGPSAGLENLNYGAFNQAQSILEEVGYTALNPANVDDGGRLMDWGWYMRRTIGMLMEADGVALLPNWQDSRGASIEVELAAALNMPTKEIGEWLDVVERHRTSAQGLDTLMPRLGP